MAASNENGMTKCSYYVSKIGELEHKCCGGKITKYAIINCLKKGRINAREHCKASCRYCTISRQKIDVGEPVLERASNHAPQKQQSSENQLIQQPRKERHNDMIMQPAQRDLPMENNNVSTPQAAQLVTNNSQNGKTATKTIAPSLENGEGGNIWQLWAQEIAMESKQ